ncbi:ArabFuran-catal-domain-containing protein [Teratosphaeria nubilosa]|uniref:Alpha-L-arabinofuranosidase n=1 Tax=Teratosphaeria nubilosa TaxID=161662 RepID=A0A6G1LGT2_9PEZI|nr:ArabFuran-catal-domain-containing protein [Teratosphaeria nubilosa]
MSPRSFFHCTVSIATIISIAAAAPCDIYHSANTPCVAAHSTIRALYDSFNSALYQVLRQSDGQTAEISPRKAGGVADAEAQDRFCVNTTCIINVIYDQSGRSNHLSIAPSGGATGGPGKGPLNGGDYPASGFGAPVTLNGEKAYGVFISPNTGYRNNQATGLATGDEPQGMYAIVDGTHFKEACCFDYGNAETSSDDTGDSHMEAIYFGPGDGTGRGKGAGSGPWIMGDLENGLWPGDPELTNEQNPTQTSRFVTAIVKGDSGNKWAIRGGDANSGGLTTYFEGPRPAGYNPMHKEGAIILGIGGDNSNSAQGTFYEGAITTSYPPDSAENSIQSNILSQNYQPASLITGAPLNPGSALTIRATSPGHESQYLSHSHSTVLFQSLSSSPLPDTAKWRVASGLGLSGCISLESVDTPGQYIRHSGAKLRLDADGGGDKQFREDATFCPQMALSGSGTHTFRSWNFPVRNVRVFGGGGDGEAVIAYNGGQTPFVWDAFSSAYGEEVSFVVEVVGG